MMMQDPLRLFLSPLNQEVAQKLQKTILMEAIIS